MALKTINVKKFRVTWGSIILQGFDKDIITIEVPEDSWDVTIGADGEITRINKSIDHAKITINLAQSSDSNDKLSAAWNLDRISGGGVFPFEFNDGSGRSFVLASETFILKPADLSFGNTAKPRTWVFMTGDALINHGGN